MMYNKYLTEESIGCSINAEQIQIACIVICRVYTVG